MSVMNIVTENIFDEAKHKQRAIAALIVVVKLCLEGYNL